MKSVVYDEQTQDSWMVVSVLLLPWSAVRCAVRRNDDAILFCDDDEAQTSGLLQIENFRVPHLSNPVFFFFHERGIAV
jgi:hypothetical protein